MPGLLRLAAVLVVALPVLAFGAAPVPFYGTEAEATKACTDDTVVWINKLSKVYHLKGGKWFGKTKDGGYGCRKAADLGGYKAAK
ncbi:MAG: hypothetical protein GC191_05295 [Azospirillum sp.]|nr:hypothetical protein [Azospirillum sp.]